MAPSNDGSGGVNAYITVNAGQSYPVITSDPGDLLQWTVQPPAAAPQVTTNTNPAPFAAQPVGQNSAALPVTLANNGAGPLQVTQATLGGANPNDFAVTSNTCTGQVAPGSSCTIEVAFKPTAGGPRSATLSIADNAPDSPQSVTLSGTGIDTQQTAVAAQQTAAAQQAAAQQTAAAQQAAAQQTAAAATQQTAIAQQTAAQQTSAAQAGHSATVPPATTPTASPAPASTSTAMPAPTSTRGAGGTMRPRPTSHPHAPTLALIVQLLDKSVATGGSLRLHLRTVPHARIGVTLQVLTTRLVVTGKGKHRKRVQHTVVLYNLTGHGTTDKHGVLNGRIRVSYKPQHPVQAVLTVTATASHSVVRRTLHLTIRPLSHRHH